MKRREAIRQMFVLSGGILIATACRLDPEQASIELKNISLTAKDESLLAKLVDVIIPPGDTSGAGELNLHIFVMKMVDDCTSPEQQKQFLDGLKKAHKQSQDSQSLSKYLADLPQEDVFFTVLKSRTVQGYLNSQYVMTNHLKYELVPGRYNGEVRI